MVPYIELDTGLMLNVNANSSIESLKWPLVVSVIAVPKDLVGTWEAPDITAHLWEAKHGSS